MRTAPITSPARLAVAVAVLVSCLGAAGVARAEAPPRNDVWPRDINIVSSRGDSQIMSVTNTGGANLKDIRWHVDGPSGGRVSEGPGSTCSFESLPHGAACSLTLVWHPSSDRLGTWNPTLRITANGPTVSMPMTLSSVDPPMLSTDPDPVSFGDARAGIGVTQRRITIRSGVAGRTAVVRVAIAGPDRGDFQVLQDGCWRAHLPPHGACVVTVGAAPPGDAPVGPVSAQLQVSSIRSAGVATTTLRATVLPPPGVTVRPQAVSIDSAGVIDGQPATVTIADDAGAPPLHLGELSLWGPGAGSFSIANDDCSARTVSPGENCRLSVRFSLSRRGPRAAYLQVPTLRGGSFWVQLSADVPAQMTDISTSSSVIRWCAGCTFPGATLRFTLTRPATVRLVLQTRRHERWRSTAVSLVHGEGLLNERRLAGRWSGQLVPARRVRVLVQLRGADDNWRTHATLPLSVRSPFTTRVLQRTGMCQVCRVLAPFKP